MLFLLTAVTAGTFVSQCAEIARIALGLHSSSISRVLNECRVLRNNQSIAFKRQEKIKKEILPKKQKEKQRQRSGTILFTSQGHAGQQIVSENPWQACPPKPAWAIHARHSKCSSVSYSPVLLLLLLFLFLFLFRYFLQELLRLP